MRHSEQVRALSSRGKTSTYGKPASHKKRKHQLAIEKAKRVQINEIVAVKPRGIVDKLSQIFGVSHASDVSNCSVANVDSEASLEKNPPQLATTTKKENRSFQTNAVEGSEIHKGKFPFILDEDYYGQSETVSDLIVCTGDPTATSTPNTTVDIHEKNGNSDTFDVRDDLKLKFEEKVPDVSSSYTYLKAPLAHENADVIDEAGSKAAAKPGSRESDLASVSKIISKHQQVSISVMEGLKELVNAGFTVHLSGQALSGINAPEPEMSRFEMRKKRKGKAEAKKRRRANGFKSRASRIYHANIRKQKKAQEQLKNDSIHVASSPHQLGTSFVGNTAPVAPQNELFEPGEFTMTHCNQELEVSRDFHNRIIDHPTRSISNTNSGSPENMVFFSPPDDDNTPAQGSNMESSGEEHSSRIPDMDEIQSVPALPEIPKAQVSSTLYHKLLAQCSSGLDPISLLERRKKVT